MKSRNKTRFKPRYKEDKLFEGKAGVCENLNGNLDNAVWNKLYKRKCIEEVRFPIGRRYEDVATVYLFLSKANRVGYICKGLYYYVKHSDSFIGKSFNGHSRYECFLGYKERLEYAINNKLDCIEACRVQAVETALNTLTTFYANNEQSNSEIYNEVVTLIRENCRCIKGKLKTKQKIMLWSFFNAPWVHKIYAKLSAMSKG